MPGCAVNEPANHTAWVDADGDAWAWGDVEEFGPFTPADPERTERAIAIVRRVSERTAGCRD